MGLPDHIRRCERVLRVAVPLVMAIGTVLYGMAYHQTLFDPLAMGLACCGLLGVSYVWFVLTLYAELARRSSLQGALAVIVVAAVAEQLAATGLNLLLDDLGQVAVCVGLPVVAACCVARLKGRRAKEPARVLCAEAAERYQVFLVIAMGLASVTLSRISSVGDWGSSRLGYGSAASMLLVLAACVFMVLLCWLFVGRFLARPLAVRYQPAFLVVLAGYAAGLFAVPRLPEFWGSALDLGFEFYGHVIRWMVAVDAVQHLRFRPYRVVGLALAAGPLVAMVWQAVGGNSALVGGVALAVAYAVVLFISLAPAMTGRLRSRGWLEVDDEGLAPQALAGDPSATGAVLMKGVRRRCVYLAREYGLTGREAEVLELLVCGHTRALIQEDLALSESTVKTHIKHIYGKFEVANVTELMGLVFSER